MSMQKNKGNGWERDCAKILTKIFGEHFNRNISGSGNYLGGKNAFRKSILSNSQIVTNKGDIVCPDSFNGKFVIECKFYKEFPFHHLLINKSIPVLEDWISQQQDVIEKEDFWCIIFKINHCGSFIVIPQEKCDFLTDDNGNYSVYYSEFGKMIITEFEEFVSLYKEQIKTKCN